MIYIREFISHSHNATPYFPLKEGKNDCNKQVLNYPV